MHRRPGPARCAGTSTAQVSVDHQIECISAAFRRTARITCTTGTGPRRSQRRERGEEFLGHQPVDIAAELEPIIGQRVQIESIEIRVLRHRHRRRSLRYRTADARTTTSALTATSSAITGTRITATRSSRISITGTGTGTGAAGLFLLPLAALFLRLLVPSPGLVGRRMRQRLRTGGDLTGGSTARSLEQLRDDGLAVSLVQHRVGHHDRGVPVGDRRGMRRVDLTTGESIEHGRPVGEPQPQRTLAGSRPVGDPHRSRVPPRHGRMPELHRQTTAFDLGEQRQSRCSKNIFVGSHGSELGDQLLVRELEHIPPCLHTAQAIPTHRHIPAVLVSASIEYGWAPSRSRGRRRIPSG